MTGQSVSLIIICTYYRYIGKINPLKHYVLSVWAVSPLFLPGIL